MRAEPSALRDAVSNGEFRHVPAQWPTEFGEPVDAMGWGGDMTDEVSAIVEESEPAVLTPATITLVEGPTFCVSSASGDMEAEVPQGLFFRDMWVISNWRVRVDGVRPHHLTVIFPDPYRTTFLARVPPHGSQSELLVERARHVGEGMREDLKLRNLSPRALTVAVSLDIGADFADVFAVKESRVRPQGEVTARPDGSVLEFDLRSVRHGAAYGCRARAPTPARTAWTSGPSPPTASGAPRCWCGTASTRSTPVVSFRWAWSRRTALHRRGTPAPDGR
ncbi:glycogen debranching N-terminal domain-containing protein [Streptomyces sp. NPDC046832]|uniref:glycogen debranching N-terminal domain-containing protein n=1 Tax=Streptomyces sp. NPDC046832 TaxID=3155020 RepID=UPI0033D0DEDC